MAKTGKAPNRFTGRWRIVSMSMWDDDYLDEEAFIEFDEKGSGSFQFGYVQGMLDHRMTKRGGEPAVEFSWEGGDGADGTHMDGTATCSVQLFDQTGAAALKVFLNFGGALSPEREAWFSEVRKKFGW